MKCNALAFDIYISSDRFITDIFCEPLSMTEEYFDTSPCTLIRYKNICADVKDSWCDTKNK